jgi:ketosteroid isomerase-like protein
MSRENVEFARNLYAAPIDMALMIRDPEATEAFRRRFEPMAHPDFETRVDPASLPLGFAPTAYGPEGFLGIFREWIAAFESWTATATEFIDLGGDRVLVMVTFVARWEGQRAELETEGANLLTTRDGKIARMELFLDRAAALEAAGLSE